MTPPKFSSALRQIAAWGALPVLLVSARAEPAAPAWPPPPGNVVAVSPEPATDFLGSPSIVTLPDGTYLAAHDFFGRNARRLHSARVFASRDRGVTWSQVGAMTDQFWPMLFMHRGGLYLIGTSKEYGDIVIRRSTDGGHTWTVPTDEKNGLLFRGRFHCAPVPFASHQGRLWRGFEEYTGPEDKWSGRFFRSFVVSVSEDADLLDAANWRRTNGLDFDGDWLKGDRTGWLEGNVHVTPDHRLINLLRLHSVPSLNDRYALEGPSAGKPRSEVAAVIQVDAENNRVSFDPPNGFIHFPGSQSKFTIRFDQKSGRYWSLVQKVTNPYSGYHRDYQPNYQRNVLLLTSSTDLQTWTEHAIILRWREGLPVHRLDPVGFQYVDWQIEGDDLIAVCRTAWNGKNYHDSNFITFHRVEHFRTLTPADSAPPVDAPPYEPPAGP